MAVVDLLFPLGGEEASGVQLASEVDLARADLVVLRLVQLERWQLQILDAIVQLRSDRPGAF